MTTFQDSEYNDARFDGIDLPDATIRFKTFEGCEFIKCRLNGVKFVECSFRNCRFDRCDLSLAAVTRCRFNGVVFKDCKLVGINWTDAQWGTAGLHQPVAFEGCTLNYGTFIGLALRKLKLTRCTAHDVDFGDADLTQADLRHTDFADSRFHHTNLTEADFTHARNYQIDAAANKLKKTRFALPEAIALLRSLDIVLVDPDETE